jgi:hypothetical protein
MARNREAFLSRWSRRKRDAVQSTPESTQPAQPTSAEAQPPELPPIDSLTHESDFSGFMHKQVDDKLRRAALRKLFSDPSFNIVDGLDDYADDYTLLETLAEGAAAGLEHAKSTLLGPDWDAKPVAEPVAGSAIDADADAHPAAGDAEGEDAAAQSPEDETAPAAMVKADPAPAEPTLDTVPPLADASKLSNPSDAAKR